MNDPDERADRSVVRFCGDFYYSHSLRRMSSSVDSWYIASFEGILRRDEASNALLSAAYFYLLGPGITAMLYSIHLIRLTILHVSVRILPNYMMCQKA
jgi:hypothetical protein